MQTPQSATRQSNSTSKTKRVTVVGGGTGSSIVLSGLKKYADVTLTGVLAVSDNGGSTGRLRDEFGFLAVGDMRQALAALADGEQQEIIRKVLLYRFEKGFGLKGHNLGNLILTALAEISPSPARAVQLASEIFRTRGKIMPVTETSTNIVIQYADGKKVVGEKYLDEPKYGGRRIAQISLKPSVNIYAPAAEAISQSNLVIMGPGDVYGSLLPNTLAHGFIPALQAQKGAFVFVLNLMSHYAQTHGMSASEIVAEVTRYCQRQPDTVVVNNGQITKEVLAYYAQNKEFPVVDDLLASSSLRIVRKDLLDLVTPEQSRADSVHRSLLRHDKNKLASVLHELL